MHVPKPLIHKQLEHRKIHAAYKSVFFFVINVTAVPHTSYFSHVMKKVTSLGLYNKNTGKICVLFCTLSRSVLYVVTEQ
jgi:predicted solute-binding protein